MIKTKIFILTITLFCGLVAGSIAFYQQQKISQTISVDIISTIVPTEQDRSLALTVTIDSLQYNQTLAAILNVRANGRSPLQKNKFSSISWEADLNSAILHAQAQISDQANAGLIQADLVNIIQENANKLNAKQFDNKISSKFSLLSSSSPSSPFAPTSSFYPYLITLLGLLVGFCIGVLLIQPAKR